MSTRLKADLEAAIMKWLNENCEEDDWPNHYVAPSTYQRMAEAAYAVFMANVEGQQYREQEGE